MNVGVVSSFCFFLLAAAVCYFSDAGPFGSSHSSNQPTDAAPSVENITVRTGEKNVTLKCSSSDTVEWRRGTDLIYSGGKILLPGYSIHIGESHYDLIVNDASSTCAGYYKCFKGLDGTLEKGYNLAVVNAIENEDFFTAGNNDTVMHSDSPESSKIEDKKSTGWYWMVWSIGVGVGVGYVTLRFVVIDLLHFCRYVKKMYNLSKCQKWIQSHCSQSENNELTLLTSSHCVIDLPSDIPVHVPKQECENMSSVLDEVKNQPAVSKELRDVDHSSEIDTCMTSGPASEIMVRSTRPGLGEQDDDESRRLSLTENIGSSDAVSQ